MRSEGVRAAKAVARRTFTPALPALAIIVALSACSNTTPPAKTSAQPPSGGSTAMTSTAAVQMCADCNGKGMPPKVSGSARMVNGVQLVDVGVKDGYYAPNAIEAKAGVPLRIVFAGSAKGCLAKPKFPALNVKGDFTAGTATLDLGTLQPGTYTFTCAMDKNAGTVVVR